MNHFQQMEQCLVFIVLLVFSISGYAGVPFCDAETHADPQECKFVKFEQLNTQYFDYLDRLQTGEICRITVAELKALNRFHVRRYKETNAKCGGDRDCYWDELSWTYSEIEKFAAKKIERQQRHLKLPPSK